MASWLVRSSPDRAVLVRALGGGNCVVFLGKTLNSHSASLHPGVKIGTGKFNAGGNPAMDWHTQSLHTTETGDKRWPDGPLGPNADFAFMD